MTSRQHKWEMEAAHRLIRCFWCAARLSEEAWHQLMEQYDGNIELVRAYLNEALPCGRPDLWPQSKWYCTCCKDTVVLEGIWSHHD